MAIDLKKLLEIAQGDQEAKVAVKRSWLAEVYRLIKEGERAKQELADLREQMARQTYGLEEENPWESVFGEKGAFSKIFGGKKTK